MQDYKSVCRGLCHPGNIQTHNRHTDRQHVSSISHAVV